MAKRKSKNKENVPLIRSNSSSTQDLTPTTSNDYQPNSKWTHKVLLHSQNQPKTYYSSTNSSSERLSDQTGRDYYLNQAISDSDNEELEFFNKRHYFKRQDQLNNNTMSKLNKSISIEHISCKTNDKKKLNHPPYNHQNSNRSDLALVEEKCNSEGATSNLQTMMHLLKGNVGTGILAMPNAMGNAGLLTGTILLPIIGTIAVHCMHLLVNSHNAICKRFAVPPMDYEDVAEHSVLCGPKCLRKFATFFRRLVMMFLLVTQIGFCCAYSIFVAETLNAVIKNLTLGRISLSVHVYMLLELPIMIAVCLIRDLKTLSIFSTLANVLQSIGLGIILFALFKDLPPTWSRPQWNSFETLPLYFGTVVYAFEGIGIVLPLQKEMREQKAFRGFFGVLNTGMVLVGALYVAIGFFGYLKFGDAVLNHGSITLNLPFTPLNETVKLMFALALFLTFPLQFYVPMNMLWPILMNKYNLEKDTTKATSFEYTFKALMVTITFLIAAAVPKLDLFISLIGALSSSSLALIFPPIIEMLVKYDDDRMTKTTWRLIIIKNVFIISFGIIGFLLGTYMSSRNIYYELFA